MDDDYSLPAFVSIEMYSISNTRLPALFGGASSAFRQHCLTLKQWPPSKNTHDGGGRVRGKERTPILSTNVNNKHVESHSGPDAVLTLDGVMYRAKVWGFALAR